MDENTSNLNKEDCDSNQDYITLNSANSDKKEKVEKKNTKTKYPISEIIPKYNNLYNIIHDNDNTNENNKNIKNNFDLLSDELINEIYTYPSPLKKLSQNILINIDKHTNKISNTTINQIDIFKDIKSKIAKSSSKFLSMSENANEANNLNTLLIDKYNNQTTYSLNESDYDSDVIEEKCDKNSYKQQKLDKLIKSKISSMLSSRRSSIESSCKYQTTTCLILKKNNSNENINSENKQNTGDLENINTNTNIFDNSISKHSKRSFASSRYSNQSNEINFSTFDEQFRKYYMGSTENVAGLYDLYVTNCIKLISYIDSKESFMSRIEEIRQSINNNMKLEFSKDKPLLILDLDETLIHSDLEMKYEKHDKYLEISSGVIPLNIRPHIYDFLDYCFEYFEMAIYTASCSDYADPILDYIEQEKGKKYFKYRFYREHCIYYKNLFLKDLSIFGKSMDQIIIVDNCLFSFAHYLDNGILVTSFYEDEEDLDLLSIIEFFKSSILDADSTDVRDVIKNTFEFSNIYQKIKNIEFNSN